MDEGCCVFGIFAVIIIGLIAACMITNYRSLEVHRRNGCEVEYRIMGHNLVKCNDTDGWLNQSTYETIIKQNYKYKIEAK